MELTRHVLTFFSIYGLWLSKFVLAGAAILLFVRVRSKATAIFAVAFPIYVVGPWAMNISLSQEVLRHVAPLVLALAAVLSAVGLLWHALSASKHSA